MSRQDEFAAGRDMVTLYHGTRSAEAAESIRQTGIDLGRSRTSHLEPDPVIWASRREMHQPSDWSMGSGWGKEYRLPSFPHVVEFQVPHHEVADQLALPGNERVQNVQLRRSVRPDEITTIHDVEALHAGHISKARELHKVRNAEIMAEINAPKKRKKK